MSISQRHSKTSGFSIRLRRSKKTPVLEGVSVAEGQHEPRLSRGGENLGEYL